MTKTPKKTFVTFVLDETGSMQPIKQPAIDGYNGYIEELGKSRDADSIRFTLVKFDSNHQTVVHDAKKLNRVPRLNADTYTPGAMTPLIDAAMLAIENTEKQVKTEKKAKAIVVIQTDGHENVSTKHTAQDLKRKIERLKEQGWAFVFIGAGIDAYAPARMFGIDEGNTVSYAKSEEGSRAIFGATAAVTQNFAAGSSATYTAEQKRRAGDARHKGA